MTIRKVIIDKLNLPVYDYWYDVQLLTSVDGGQTFWYAGFGKFTKTLTDAIKAKHELEIKNGITE